MNISLFFFGTKLFGKVDRLANGAHVASLFHHVCGIPLVYQGTFLIVGRDGGEFQGITLPISWKSIFLAYLRAALYVLLFSGIAAPVIAYTEHSVSAFNFFFISIPMGLIGLFITYWLGLPNPERKQELKRIGKDAIDLY